MLRIRPNEFVSLTEQEKSAEISRLSRNRLKRQAKSSLSDGRDKQKKHHEYHRVHAISRKPADHYAIHVSNAASGFSRAFKAYLPRLKEKLGLKRLSLAEIWHILYRNTNFEADMQVNSNYRSVKQHKFTFS